MDSKAEIAPLIPHSASIAGQVWLLLTDAELWTVAPGHAYGLIAITVVDLLAYTLFSPRFQLRRRLLALWALIKLALFLGDVLTAPEFGTTYLEFAAYLFSLPGYVVALVAQPAVIATSLLVSRGRIKSASAWVGLRTALRLGQIQVSSSSSPDSSPSGAQSLISPSCCRRATSSRWRCIRRGRKST